MIGLPRKSCKGKSIILGLPEGGVNEGLVTDIAIVAKVYFWPMICSLLNPSNPMPLCQVFMGAASQVLCVCCGFVEQVVVVVVFVFGSTALLAALLPAAVLLSAVVLLSVLVMVLGFCFCLHCTCGCMLGVVLDSPYPERTVWHLWVG